MATKKQKTAARKNKRKAKLNSKKVVAAKGKLAKTSRKKQPAASKQNRKRKIRGRADSVELVSYGQRGLGPGSGGQSGDTQGISGAEETDSESVEKLLEEGQSYEAEVVAGVEKAPAADESEVHTKEVPEDDVPGEYRERD
jgi:hypothetical protein